MSDFEAYRAQVAAAAEAARSELIARVQVALERVRPELLADGGDCQLMDVRDGVVSLKLIGACGSCGMSQMHLRMGIERSLKEAVPEIVRIDAY
jgi:Fe-S cluster biogenesis protein NfuA